MREIKFRAWDDNLEVMFDWEYVMIDKDGTWIKSEPTESSLDNNLILMQYTGLHDKNGVEIYEGDILRYEIFTTEGYSYISSIVEFKDFSFMLIEQQSKVYYTMQRLIVSCGWKDIEVIGNIYENQELLEVQS